MHEELFDKYVTDKLSAEEAGRLTRLIQDDPRVRDAMVAYVRETGLIIQVAHHLEAVGRATSRNSTGSIPVVPTHRAGERDSRAALRVASIAAVALAGLAGLFFLLMRNRPAESPEILTKEAPATTRDESAARPSVQMVRPETVREAGSEPIKTEPSSGAASAEK